jgi:DNA-directed RNA polymerase subunit RPC12/RpoP
LKNNPRQTLRELIAEYGPSLCDEPGRCEGLLRDLCPHERGEVNVLLNALKERVAAELLQSSLHLLQESLMARLRIRLEEHQGMSEEAARWAVESWAFALGQTGSPGQSTIECPHCGEGVLVEEAGDYTCPYCDEDFSFEDDQVSGETTVECPHCGEGVLVEEAGDYTCPYCDEDFTFEDDQVSCETTVECPHCGKEVLVEEDGEYKCPYCDEDFTVEDDQVSGETTVECPHCGKEVLVEALHS